VERFFYSRFRNRIDRKGRVSVPALWRPILAAQGFNGCVVYPSPVVSAIEGCGRERIDRMAESIDTLNPFSGEHSDFATTLLSAATPLPFDSEGRVMLPEEMTQVAGIADAVIFVGHGATFQIWNPDAFAAYEPEAARRTREAAPTLRLLNRGNGQGDTA
jgi:MraZ protein